MPGSKPGHRFGPRSVCRLTGRARPVIPRRRRLAVSQPKTHLPKFHSFTPATRLARTFAYLVLTLHLCGMTPVRGQQVVDQILALVNDEAITRSDVLWDIALDSKAPSPTNGVPQDMMRQKLDLIIEQRLIVQEASRVPAGEISAEEVDRKRGELITQFPSETAFRQRAESVGLTPEKLDEMVRRHIVIDRFVNFRFTSFVFVTEAEIQKYYQDHLVPDIRRQGQVPPPIDQVRGSIAERLKAEKINADIDKWLEEIRRRADIVSLAEP